MKKYGVVDPDEATCTICGSPATTSLRGEARCADHTDDDDQRTGMSKAAEDRDVDARSR